MDDVKALMEEAGTGFLATTDGHRAAVRPMGGCAWVGEEFWMATGRPTDKAADIRACPEVEICYMNGQKDHVRIAGPCRVSEDRADKQTLLDRMPMLAEYVRDADNPDYVVLRLTPTRVRVMRWSEHAYQDVR